MLGEAQTGKTLLTSFLRHSKLQTIQYSTIGGEPPHYEATWGIKCYQTSQQVTDLMTANLNLWETGDFFLKQFPSYMAFVACEADLIVYMVSVDEKHDSAVRSA